MTRYRDSEEYKFAEKLSLEIIAYTKDEYFSLDSAESCLDGRFSSQSLRVIADKMDELKAKYPKT
jgi:hypothetical protein